MKKTTACRLWYVVVSLIALALHWGARGIYNCFGYLQFKVWSTYLLWFSIMIISIGILEWLISNKIYKGFKYFINYVSVKHLLEKQMIDAGVYVNRGNLMDLPRVKLSFSKDFSSGVLIIRNSLKFNNKLDLMVLSSALRQYIVERHYVTDDGNYYIYELVDGSVSYRLTFNSYDEYLRHVRKIPNYSIFLDKRSVVKLQHCLLVGVTGSGKTYCLYNFLLQFFNKKIPYEMYYADPKGSSLAVIGQTVAPDRTAVDMEHIIALLEEFVLKMRERKAEIKELLKSRLDADYSYFNRSPYIFCFDEYASFVSVLSNEDKKTRDKVNALISEVILQGRQLGFFMFIIMQKSDANLISTSIRDNIPLKLVLGNSEQQTYVTAFGTGVDIPNRHYKVGEGVFTEPVLAPEPKLVQCPYLNFDILEVIRRATPVM